MAQLNDLIVTGASRFLNTINGKITNASTADYASSVTWNNVGSKPTTFAPVIGSGSTQAAAGNHTHTTNIATSTGTNQLTMAANTKYALGAGGTTYIFTTPPDNNTTYGTFSTSVNGLVPKPASAATTSYLNSSGTWTTPTNTTYANVSTSAAGLAPKVTDTGKFLKGDGTWATPTNTTYANATTAASGLLLTLAGGTTKYLRADGSWQVPPDNNTTYGTFSTSVNGLVPKPASAATTSYLNSSGTWTTPANTTYSFSNNAATLSFGGASTIGTVGGVNLTVKMPSNPNTDTKVTSEANHYSPNASTASELSADASGATAAWSIDVVKGVKIQRDSKGHVTGVTVTSGKIPSNPNTDTKVTAVGNHYTPTTNNASSVSVDASGGSAGTWGTTQFVTGVTLKRDAAYHVTGLEIKSAKLPSNPNTDTKVTAVGNHYTPTTNNASSVSKSASGGSAATPGTTNFVTGVTLKRDAAYHVTDLEVTSAKLPTYTNVTTAGPSETTATGELEYCTVIGNTLVFNKIIVT